MFNLHKTKMAASTGAKYKVDNVFPYSAFENCKLWITTSTTRITIVQITMIEFLMTYK